MLWENGERPGSDISSDVCRGSFTNETKFWIRATTNFPIHLAVFWVSPDNQCLGLYPAIGIAAITTEIPNNPSGRIIEIGKEQDIIVKPPVGNQICVLLAAREHMDSPKGKKILNIIGSAVPDAYRRKTLGNPSLTKHTIKSREKTRGIELRDANSIHWQNELANALTGLASYMYIFTIPHE